MFLWLAKIASTVRENNETTEGRIKPKDPIITIRSIHWGSYKAKENHRKRFKKKNSIREKNVNLFRDIGEYTGSTSGKGRGKHD